VNIDGFNSGEKGEIFWGIRAYELAIESGIKFFVWGNLPYAYKISGYNPAVRAGHADGKGRVGEWILLQNETNKNRMGAALFTTSVYVEMNFHSGTIMTPQVAGGVVTWYVPAAGARVPFVALEDCGPYMRWLFDHAGDKANGLDLQVAIQHATYDDLVAAFTKVTGKPAQWVNLSFDDYFNAIGTERSKGPAAYNADPNDPATLSFRQNFTGLWNIFRFSAADDPTKPVWHTDYDFLDSVYPGRVRSLEEWIRRRDEQLRAQGKGGIWESVQPENIKPILKLSEDGAKGKP